MNENIFCVVLTISEVKRILKFMTVHKDTAINLYGTLIGDKKDQIFLKTTSADLEKGAY